MCALHNPEGSKTDGPGLVSKLVEVAQASLPPAVARQFLSKVLAPESVRKMMSGDKSWSDFTVTVSIRENYHSSCQYI